MVVTFWDFLMFCQICQSVIINNKHGIYKLPFGPPHPNFCSRAAVTLKLGQ